MSQFKSYPNSAYFSSLQPSFLWVFFLLTHVKHTIKLYISPLLPFFFNLFLFSFQFKHLFKLLIKHFCFLHDYAEEDDDNDV